MIQNIRLPEPNIKGAKSLEETLKLRRSVRQFSLTTLSLSQISQLLWAAQGITEKGGFRTIPSAGGTYPLEIYLVSVEGNETLSAGIYRYDVETHSLASHLIGDLRGRLANASLNQDCVQQAPIDIVICALNSRTTKRYGERGLRYVHMEAGHAAENVYLQSAALDLGTVVIGAFDDEAVKKAAGLTVREQPLYIMPVGVPDL